MLSIFKSCLSSFIGLATIVILTPNTNAQSAFDDIIYLKDGSEVKGIIKELDSLGKLRILTSHGLEISVDESAVTKVKIGGHENGFGNSSVEEKRTSGFINVTQFGILAGKNTYRDNIWGRPETSNFASLSIETFNGYRFNNYISSGFSVGLDAYEEGLLIPMGATLRGNILNKRIMPTTFFTAGYSLTWPGGKTANHEYKGGFFYHTGVGILVKSGDYTDVTFHIGYKNQMSTFKEGNQEWWSSVQEKIYRRISFMIGFSF